MQTVGHIIAVQELRFRLLTEQGQVYLLTLAPNAPLDGAALRRLQRQAARVTVDFQGEPNMRGGVARDVREAVA